MAKNIDFMGATFPDVPSIRLPQHEGGLVSFDDTSDATATAGDIAKDKTAYANGEKLVGTHEDVTVDPISITSNGIYSAPSGHAYSPVSVNVPGLAPTGSQTFTENGTFDVTSIAEAVINVAGGSGLEYETGTWTPESDSYYGFVDFQKTHSMPPICFAIADEQIGTATPQSGLSNLYFDFYRLLGHGYGYSTSSSTNKTNVLLFRDITQSSGNSTTSVDRSMVSINSDNTKQSSFAYSRYHMSTTRARIDTTNAKHLWRKDHTYKWIAIWAPTT